MSDPTPTYDEQQRAAWADGSDESRAERDSLLAQIAESRRALQHCMGERHNLAKANAGLTEERDALRARLDDANVERDIQDTDLRAAEARIARLEEALRDIEAWATSSLRLSLIVDNIAVHARNALSQDTESPRWDNADERSGRNAEGMGDTESPEEPTVCPNCGLQKWNEPTCPRCGHPTPDDVRA